MDDRLQRLALEQGESQQKLLKQVYDSQAALGRQMQEIASATLRMSATLQSQEALHRSQEGGCLALVQDLERRLSAKMEGEQACLKQCLTEIRGLGERVQPKNRRRPL